MTTASTQATETAAERAERKRYVYWGLIASGVLGMIFLIFAVVLLSRLGEMAIAIVGGLALAVGVGVLALVARGTISSIMGHKVSWSGWRDVVALSVLGVMAVVLLQLVGKVVSWFMPGDGVRVIGPVSAGVPHGFILLIILGALLALVVWGILAVGRRD